MDERRFDAVLRALGTGATRRLAVAGAVAALLGGRALAAGSAPGPGRRPGRPGVEGPCGDGSRAANACLRNSECCTRVCDRTVETRDGTGRCRCFRRGQACRASRNCCGSLVCLHEICAPVGSCRSDSDCPGATPVCCGGWCAAGTWTSQTAFGSEGTGSGNFDSPHGLALLADGMTLLAVDLFNERVSMWTRSTTSGTDWAPRTTFGSGPGAGDAEFDGPWAVAAPADGLTALVSDTSNHRVLVWRRTTATGTDWTPQTTFGSEGSGPSEFSYPGGIAVSTDGLTALIAQGTPNHRVSMWTRSTASGTDWTPRTTFGSHGSGPSEFSFPGGIALSVDGLTALIADNDNSRISVWTRSTATGTDWANQTTFGSENGELHLPFFVALSTDGLWAMAPDTFHDRVTIWARTAATATDWTLQTSFGSTGSGAGEFRRPMGVALSADGLTAAIGDVDNDRISVWRRVCP